jgi:hypothetical protein
MLRRLAASLAISGSLTALAVGALQAEPDHSPQSARDVAFVDAVTWGVTPSTMAAFTAVGKEKWLQSQLHPAADARLPDAAEAEIDALPMLHKSVFELATKFDAQARTANQMTDPDQKQAAQHAFQEAMSETASSLPRAVSCGRFMRRISCASA